MPCCVLKRCFAGERGGRGCGVVRRGQRRVGGRGSKGGGDSLPMGIQDEKLLSRRQIVSGLGAGLVTAATATTPALSQSTPAGGSTDQPLQDPTTKYPKP